MKRSFDEMTSKTGKVTLEEYLKAMKRTHSSKSTASIFTNSQAKMDRDLPLENTFLAQGANAEHLIIMEGQVHNEETLKLRAQKITKSSQN